MLQSWAWMGSRTSDSCIIVKMLFVGIALLFLCGLYLAASIKVLRSHERAIMLRLGRRLEGIRGPGILLVLPLLDRVIRVDLDDLGRTGEVLAEMGFSPVEAEKAINELRRAKAE